MKTKELSKWIGEYENIFPKTPKVWAREDLYGNTPVIVVPKSKPCVVCGLDRFSKCVMSCDGHKWNLL